MGLGAVISLWRSRQRPAVAGAAVCHTCAWQPRALRGTDGPEGSILCIPIMLLVIVVLLFTRSSPQPGLETKGHVDEGASEEIAEVELARA